MSVKFMYLWVWDLFMRIIIMRSFVLDFLFLYYILMEFNLQSAFTHVTSSYMKAIRININIYISRKAESPCAQGPGASS